MPRIRKWIDRIVQYPKRFSTLDNGDGTITLNPQPGTVAQVGTPIKAAMLNAIETDLQLSADIVGTTQTPTFTNGQVTKIEHKDSGDGVIRTDTFAYTANLITEVRTLNTVDTLTFKYHTDTLQTEVI